MELSLAGKVALVTGASRGIGKAIAKAYADAGASVLLSSRKLPDLEAAATEIGGDVDVVVANAGDPDQAAAAVDRCLERFGGLDILVNNAATNPYMGSTIDIDLARYDKTWEVNHRGPLVWSQLAWARAMRERGGSIINISSVGGLTVEPAIGIYNGTKAALLHLTRTLAAELAPGVRVNAIAPGLVKTDMARALWEPAEAQIAAGMPLQRLGEPADIANAALFLASDLASWITGQTIIVDGGALLGPGARREGLTLPRREDPRPPIEVLGGEPPGEPPRRVTLGSSGGGRGRGVALVALAVMALVVAGLLLGGGDDGGDAAEQATTSTTRARRPRPSTTTTVYVPSGPVLGAPTGGTAIVLSRSTNRWVHLDLDTGERTEVRIDGARDIQVPTGVRRGVVLIDGSTATYIPLPEGDSVDLGPAVQSYATGNPDEVWLVQDPGYFGPPDDDDATVTARIVSIPDGRPLSKVIEVPEGYVTGATDAGLIVTVGARNYLIDRGGTVHPLPTAEVITTAMRWLLLRTCDDSIHCRTALWDAVTGASSDLDVGDLDFGVSMVASPAGEIAIVLYRDTNELLVGTVGGPLRRADLPGSFGALAGWLPAGQGLVGTSSSGDVVRYVVAGDDIEAVPIEPLEGYSPDFVAIVPG